jgi:hypothetical protein
MKIVVGKSDTRIVLGEHEDERGALRAIVKASFEFATPVALTVVDYRPGYALSDSEADEWIRPIPRSYDACVVEMNYVQGRQCKTVLLKETDREFRLYDKYFERFRGTPLPVLEHAKALFERSGQSSRQVPLERPTCLATN